MLILQTFFLPPPTPVQANLQSTYLEHLPFKQICNLSASPFKQICNPSVQADLQSACLKQKLKTLSINSSPKIGEVAAKQTEEYDKHF